MPRWVYNTPDFYPLQARCMFGPERFACVEGSTKSGKTVVAQAWLIEELIELGKGEYTWLAPVFDQAKIAYENIVGDEQFNPVIGRKVETPFPRIELRNGAIIRFSSGDKPDSLYGHANKALVVDEASRCRQAAYEAAYTTLTATKGRARLIGNVRGRGWFYNLCRRAEAGQMLNWRHYQITWRDAVAAGVLDQAIIDQAKADLPGHKFREDYECTPADSGSNPYGFDTIQQATRRELSNEPSAAFGIDLAKSVDWTVVNGLDSDGAVTCLERWQKAPWEVTIQRIKALVGNVPALVDSTGVGDPIVERLRQLGPNFEGFVFTERTRTQLIESQAAALQHGQAMLYSGEPHGVQLVSELQSMQIVDVNGKPKYQVPDGQHDDCLFAHALAVRKLTRPRKRFYVA